MTVLHRPARLRRVDSINRNVQNVNPSDTENPVPFLACTF